MHRDSSGRWRRLSVERPRFASTRVVAIEQDAFMLLWDDGTSVRTRIVRPNGTLEPEQVALVDATLVWVGDFEASLWQVRADGRGTVVVASRTATVPSVSGGGVIAAIREPGGVFGPQQTLHPAEPTTNNAQAAVAISPIAPDGTVSVGWDLQDWSVEPQRGLNGPWRQATRTAREAAFGEASAPSTGPFGTPVDIEGPQTDAQGRIITVGNDVVRLCRTQWVSCLDRQILPLDGRPALVFLITTGLIQDQVSTFLPETLLEGHWAAHLDADGAFSRPRRVTFTRSAPLASVDGRGLLLAGPSTTDSSTAPMTLTPVGRDLRSRPATPRAQARFYAEGSRSQVQAWCTRRCILSARLRYAGRTGQRAPVRLSTIPTPPRRTLDPGEQGVIPLRLTAGPQARRLTLTLTARDMRGRTRTTTFSYGRDGRLWKQVRR